MTTLQVLVLSFGLSIMPWVFTKMTKPWLTNLSQLIVEIIKYLDDWMIHAPDCRHCKAHRDLGLDHSCQMGFLFTLAKSHLNPT